MRDDKEYTSVEKVLGKLAGEFYVMEEQVDVDVQMEYFKMVKENRKELNEEEVISDFDMIYSEEVLLQDKKIILVKLAGIQSVNTFRILEKYYKEDKVEDLKDWSILAYNEAKMQLESSLKDQNSIFVSTGMGGKGSALRYFIVLFPHEDIGTFTDFHTEFVQKELRYILEQFDSKLEGFNEINEKFVAGTALIPVHINLQDCLSKVFDACNQFAPFVSERFIVTNIKSMSPEEILNFRDEDDQIDESGNLDVE